MRKQVHANSWVLQKYRIWINLQKMFSFIDTLAQKCTKNRQCYLLTNQWLPTRPSPTFLHRYPHPKHLVSFLHRRVRSCSNGQLVTPVDVNKWGKCSKFPIHRGNLSKRSVSQTPPCSSLPCRQQDDSAVTLLNAMRISLFFMLWSNGKCLCIVRISDQHKTMNLLSQR